MRAAGRCRHLRLPVVRATFAGPCRLHRTARQRQQGSASPIRGRFKVIIIGAGTGGLCLAQGLRADRIAVEVYERDRSAVERLAGDRLSIGKAGRRALLECLPHERFDRLLANAALPSLSVSVLDRSLNHLLAIDLPHDGQSADTELAVSRVALRRIMLEGIEPAVRFGKRFVRYEEVLEDIVTAHFDDGSTAIGDVLVGADGVNSAVRAQLLPQAQRVETGIVAIAGKLPLDYATRRIIPGAILRGPTLVFGLRGLFLFAYTVDYDDTADATLVPQAPRLDRSRYVLWRLSARRAAFGDDVLQMHGAALKEVVLGLIAQWHPALVRLVRSSDPAAISAFAVKSSVPIPPWPTRNVTLLGDALHNMTPFRGIGATAALRDAAALRRALKAVDRNERELIPALAAYERTMNWDGFADVRASLREMKRMHAERWWPRLRRRLALSLPIAKRRWLAR